MYILYFRKGFVESCLSIELLVFKDFVLLLHLSLFNPLPPMPILGSSSSAANKSMMSKIWTNGVQLSD